LGWSHFGRCSDEFECDVVMMLEKNNEAEREEGEKEGERD
jgi:hypothetical protein